MSSQFYKRYIPPPKVAEAGGQTVRNSAVRPTEGSQKSPKRSKKVRDPEIKISKKQEISNDLPTRPLTNPETTDKSTRLSAPTPDNAGRLTEAAILGPETGHAVEKHGLTPFPQLAGNGEEPRVSISSALPEWIRVPTIASSFIRTPFDKFRKEGSIGGKIVSNLLKRGFVDANGLQSSLLPMLLPGHQGPGRYYGDICISAATGSGKTLAYALPMVESLRSKAVTRLRGLIVVPTRELVTQARETLEMCSAGTGVKIGTAVGTRNLKDEQTLLIQKDQRWDPAACKAEREKEIDEDEELMNWDFDAVLGSQDNFECWPHHVLEYRSKIDIIICTPGRLVEHIKSTKGFHLNHVQWLVIDEADRLLAESFQDWVDIVIPSLEHLPPVGSQEQEFYKTFRMPCRRDMRKVVLSATMTRNVSKLMSLRLKHPRSVVLESSRTLDGNNSKPSEDLPHDEEFELPRMLQEVAVAVAELEDKPLYLLQVLRTFCQADVGGQQKHNETMNGEAVLEGRVEPTDQSRSDGEYPSDVCSVISRAVPLQKEANFPGTLVFANSNEGALRLARLLAIMLPKQRIKALTKLPSGKDGRKTLRMFCKGELSVIVATDLASRGLDIPDLAHVINYDMPSSLKSYVHRVGRTARAGKEGRATTLVEHRQAKWFWKDIGRTNHVARAQKVVREDRGLRAEEHDRKEYEVALSILGQEAIGTSMGEDNEVEGGHGK